MEGPAWIALLQSSKGTWSEKGDVKIRGILAVCKNFKRCYKGDAVIVHFQYLLKEMELLESRRNVLSLKRS